MDFEIVRVVTNWQEVSLILPPILSGIKFNLTCFIFVERDSPSSVWTTIYREVYNFLIDNIRTTLHRISFVIHFLSIMNRLSGLEGCK